MAHETVERNKAQIRRWLEEGDNGGNVAIADEVFAPDVVMHHPTSPEPLRGVEVIKAGSAAFHTAFADFLGTVDDVIGEGDKVTVRWTIGGVHRGEFMGIPGTGRPFRFSGIGIYRFVDRQIGAMPPS